jgi:hypothetical protein
VKTLATFALALLLGTGAALAQGTESGPGGYSSGREAGAMPTPEQCREGWNASYRMTQAEFYAACVDQLYDSSSSSWRCLGTASFIV